MTQIKNKKSIGSVIPQKSLLDAQQITIEKFRLVKGSITSDPDFEPENVKGYNLDTDFEMGFIVKNNKVRSIFRVEIATESGAGQKGEAKGSFVFYYYFNVDNLNTLTSKQTDGLINVHRDLANAIASVTYSTTRGMLMARLQNTALENFILPVVNPNDVAKGKLKKSGKK